MHNTRHIILDTETTGFEPAEGHRIVEIGCLELINFQKTGRTFHRYINPLREVPESAFKVHGLSYKFLKNHQQFPHIAKEFLDFIQDGILVIHNASFDIKFLNHELKLIKESPLQHSVIDTLMLARQKFPGSPANLDALCKRFNISLSTREKHGALIDSELLSLVFLELIGNDKQYSLTLDKKEHISAVPLPQVNFPKRTFPLTSPEQELHEKFLLKIKNPLWKQE